MTALEKLARDEKRAELASVSRMIGSLTPADILTKLSLESRRNALQREVEAFADAIEATTASVALFFGGRPVVGSKSIDSRFGAAAVNAFQDLVAKIQTQSDGGLGKRGPLPSVAEKSLHITDVARGSFGFVLEEVAEQTTILDSPMKAAVDAASELLQSISLSSDEKFVEEIAAYDDRVIAAAAAFVGTLRSFDATARVIANDSEFRLGAEAVELAVARAQMTTIKEDSVTVYGVLSGTLPEAHMFEFRADDEDLGTFRGKVDRTIDAPTLASLNREVSGLPATAHFKRKRVFKDGEAVRTAYVLTAIERRYHSKF